MDSVCFMLFEIIFHFNRIPFFCFTAFSLLSFHLFIFSPFHFTFICWLFTYLDGLPPKGRRGRASAAPWPSLVSGRRRDRLNQNRESKIRLRIGFTAPNNCARASLHQMVAQKRFSMRKIQPSDPRDFLAATRSTMRQNSLGHLAHCILITASNRKKVAI